MANLTVLAFEALAKNEAAKLGLKVVSTLMLHKRRSRKPLAVSRTANVGLHPYGVGGIDGKAPVISIQISEYTLYITKDYYELLHREIEAISKELDTCA